MTPIEIPSLFRGITFFFKTRGYRAKLLPVSHISWSLDLVAADCCAYAYAGFHNDFIKGCTLALGCPKLDDANAYKEKLAAILRDNDIKSVTIAYMEVPCCMGLVRLVEDAARESGKNIPIKKTRISIQGQILS